MYLATTGLSEFWDTSDEVCVLHRSCLRHDRREQWRSVRWHLAPDLWEDVRVIEEAKVYCGEVYEYLLGQLAPVLNRIHGLDESTNYWRVIVGPWLLHHVHVTYERYCALWSAVKTEPNLRTRVMPEGSAITPVDTKDYLDLAAWSDAYNWQIYSQLLRRLAIPTIALEEIAGGHGAVAVVPHRRVALSHGGRTRELIPALMFALGHRVYQVARPRVLLGEMDLSRVQMFRLIWRLRSYRPATTALIGRQPARTMSRDETARQALQAITGRDEFTSLLISTLGQHCPLVHLEGFAQARQHVEQFYRRPPAVVASSTNWYRDETFKIVAAESRKRGSWLVGLQHGGGYGTNRVLPQEDIETAVVDRWLSYGWQCSRRGMIRPFVHPRFGLLRRRRPHRRLPATILFVSTNYHRYPIRLETHELPLGRFDLRMEWRDRFVRALAPAFHRRLLFTLPDKRHLGEEGDRLRALGVPLEVKATASGPFVASARIVVIEYNGTATLELLSANVPTLLFWDTDYDALRADARPYFDQLRAAGILCRTPEEIAARVGEVYSDPWSWWSQGPVQEARHAFVNRFARWDPDWLATWASELRDGVRAGDSRRTAIARAESQDDAVSPPTQPDFPRERLSRRVL